MSITFVDTTNKPRTIEELEQALSAVQNEFIAATSSPSSLMIHYVVVMDALKELIHIRKKIEKGD